MMMHRIVAMVLFCCGPAIAGLEWEQRDVEIAATPAQTQVIAEFTFTNTGPDPVTITDVKSSCGCTVPELAKRTFNAGETGSVRAIFDVGSRTGLQIKTLEVRTSDGSEPTHLKMRVLIPELVRLHPQFLFWRAGEELVAKTADLTIMTDTSISVNSVAVEGDPINVQLETIEKGRRYKVKLTPKRDGFSRATVTIQTNYPAEAPRQYQLHARGYSVSRAATADRPNRESSRAEP